MHAVGTSRGNIARTLWIALLVSWVLVIALSDWTGEGTRAWFKSQAILSVAGVIIGFIILSWQLQWQHEHTLDANRRQSQDRLKVELFTKIAERIEATAGPVAEVSTLPTAFVGELTIRERASLDRATVPKSQFFGQLDKAYQETSRTVIALMSILETHAIVMPEFAVFREALRDALQSVTVGVNDFRQAAWQFAGSDTLPVLRWPPTDEESKALSGLASDSQWAAVKLTGIVSDLRGEAQNALLGGLFPGRRVPPRVPADPSVKVTTVTSGR